MAISIPGKKKPLDTSNASPMPGMPGTNDDDLEVELIVRPPPPPIQAGTYECRLGRTQVWRNDDGVPDRVMFEFVIADILEQEKMNRGEPSVQGSPVSFNYPLDPTDWRQRDAIKFLAGMGYPISAWPQTGGGQLNFGAVLKQIKGECICNPPHTSPTFLVEVKTSHGKGANKDKLYINVKDVKKAPPRKAGPIG